MSNEDTPQLLRNLHLARKCWAGTAKLRVVVQINGHEAWDYIPDGLAELQDERGIHGLLFLEKDT